MEIIPAQAIARLLAAFGLQVTETLQLLLEQKHLYQSEYVKIEGPDYDAVYSVISAQQVGDIRNRFLGYVVGPWVPLPPKNQRVPLQREPGITVVNFEAPTINVYCTAGKCRRIQAFNTVRTSEVLSGPTLFAAERGGGANPLEGYKEGSETVQIFAFAFQCQSCKGAPEAFMVRRQNTKLTLSGRSPIEHVEVPNEIPKPERIYWQSAFLAYHVRETLAGLFMLRTLIEQHAGRVVGDAKLLGGDLVDKYTEGLHEDFKSKWPSFGDLYRKLSIALHRANASDALFVEVAAKIIKHFRAKELYGGS
jgi:hypothetical protein